MSSEIVTTLISSEVCGFVVREGAFPVGSTPEELGAYFRKEY